MKILTKGFAIALLCAGLLWIADSGVRAEINPKYSVAGDAALNQLVQKAKAGDTEADYQLGIIYLTGSGVPASGPTALSYLRQASWKGDTKASVLIAASYLFPEAFGLKLGPQDTAACQNVLKTAAKKGDTFAKKMVAYATYLGAPGLKQNQKEAADLFRQLHIPESDYAGLPEGTKFSQVFENALESAYGMTISDGKITSFDDANYPPKS